MSDIKELATEAKRLNLEARKAVVRCSFDVCVESITALTDSESAADASIDAMASRIADLERQLAYEVAALSERDKRIAELEAKLQQQALEYLTLHGQLEEALRDATRYRWLRDWLERQGLLHALFCQPEARSPAGDYWVLRNVYMVNGDVCAGYGKTEDAAIDNAIQKESGNG